MAKKARILHRGPWQIPYRAVNVLCSDGKRRTCRTRAEVDTVWTLPASVRVKGKTVAGFIQSRGTFTDDLIFQPYAYRKNGGLLPEWTVDGSCVYHPATPEEE